MDYSPPGSSVHGILQARILEWVAISFPREDFLANSELLQFLENFIEQCVTGQYMALLRITRRRIL